MKKIRTKLGDLWTRYTDWADEHFIIGLLIDFFAGAILYTACLGIALVMYDHCGWYKKYADSYPNLVRFIKWRQ